jgi:hypothetical protein
VLGAYGQTLDLERDLSRNRQRNRKRVSDRRRFAASVGRPPRAGIAPQQDAAADADGILPRQADRPAVSGRAPSEREQPFNVFEVNGLRAGQPLERGVGDARAQRARRALQLVSIEPDAFSIQ